MNLVDWDALAYTFKAGSPQICASAVAHIGLFMLIIYNILFLLFLSVGLYNSG